MFSVPPVFILGGVARRRSWLRCNLAPLHPHLLPLQPLMGSASHTQIVLIYPVTGALIQMIGAVPTVYVLFIPQLALAIAATLNKTMRQAPAIETLH